MVIHRAPDTLTTCNPELYDNMFRIDNKRADFKIDSNYPGQKDTIERSLSKEALDRLQRPSKDTIIQPSYLFRRIGKYVFLAAALPPYFLLYGIPKWLLVEALPALLSTFTMLMKKLQDKMQKPFNKIVQTLNQVVSFMHMMSKRILTPVAKLGIEIRQFFQRLNDRAQQFLHRMGKNVKAGFKKPGTIVSDLASRTKKKWIAARQWISEKTDIAQQRINDGLNWVKQCPHLLVEWGSIQLQKITNSQANWRTKVSFKFQRSKNFAQAGSNWVNRQLSAAKEKVFKGLLPLIKLYQQALKPLFNTFKKYIDSGMNKMSDFFNNRKKKAEEYLSQAQERIKAWTPQETLERLFSSNLLSKLPALLRKILAKIKQNGFFKHCFRMGFYGIQFVSLQCTKAAKLTIEGLSFVMQKIAQVYKNAAAQIRKMTQGIRSGVATGFIYCRKMWDAGFYGSLVLVIMGGYLMLWGFEWLGEITTRYLGTVKK